ncbi:hypothetical protein ABNQ38_14665 (plasmid) [Azospirillum sp. A29]|uniref:hypothetical protein n=1 Tax=Azospirillum sp. A29 TaxID=3160606 RepID=UPI00366A6B41
MTGGQTAIAGFLYQLIRTLEFAASFAAQVRLSPKQDGFQAILETEPTRGGDLSICQPGRRTVIQFKMRRGATPWGQGDLIREVLPDLFKTVEDGAAKCVFSTDAAVGLSEFRTFLDLFRDRPVPNRPVMALDDTRRDYKIGQKRVTARALFLHIGERLDRSPKVFARVWRLLAQFEIQDGMTETDALQAIDALLRIIAEHQEDVRSKRDELIGILLHFARDGRRFTHEELFRAAGLDPDRVRHAVRLPSLLGERLAEDMRALGYVPGDDARRAEIDWPRDKALLALAGESGTGKTWRLCRVAHRLSMDGHAVTILPARFGLARIEQEVVRRVWLPGYDAPLDLEVVARRVGPMLRGENGFWLTLCVDDVQDRVLADELAAPRWRRMGIRVALSAQDRIGGGLRPLRDAQVEPVNPFSLPELRCYLTAAGRDWTRLPDDVLELLRQPLMAWLYREIGSGSGWVPVNEYALMERYWQHSTAERRGQDDYRADVEAMKKLAGTVLGDQPAYPWPYRMLLSQGMDDAMRLRLVAAGLLQNEADGVAAVHDRLLNWAVAEHLADLFQDGLLDMGGLTAVLRRITRIDADWSRDFAARRLRYVPMDLLWLLAGRIAPERLVPVLLALVQDRHSHFGDNGLFDGGALDTLGARIVPALVLLVQQPLGRNEDWSLPRNVGRCLAAIGRNEPASVVQAARQLLDLGTPEARTAALVALGTVAAPDLLDRLWAIHLEHHRAFDEHTHETWAEHHHRTELSFDALASAVPADPEWIVYRITIPGPCERADQLVYLLTNMDPTIGEGLWRRSKADFLEKVDRNRRCLAEAIGIFRDRREIGRLEAWAPGEDEPRAYGHALQALARLAPEHALAYMRTAPRDELMLTRHWWLPILAHRIGEAVGRELLAIHADGDWERRRDLALVFGGLRIYLSAPIVRIIVAALEERLAIADNDPDWEPRGEGHLLNCLASLHRPDLLAVLEEQRGSRFETLLVRRASRRRGRVCLGADPDGDAYRHVLLAIGGEGIGQLVDAELARPSPFARIDGLRAALWCPTEAVRRRLRAMAETVPSNEQEARLLGYALAALGEDDAFAHFVLNGAPVVKSILDLRRGRPLLSAAVVANARAALESNDPAQRERALILLGVSNNAGALPDLAATLARHPPDSREAGLAVFALDALESFTPDLLPRLTAMLATPHRLRSLNYLLRHGGVEGRAALVRDLERHPLHSLSHTDSELAFILARHEDSRTGALTFLRRVLERGLGFGMEGQILRTLHENGDAMVRPRLHACAVQRDGEHGGWLDAIWTIARDDPEDAFSLARRHLDQPDRTALSEALMRIDAERGVEELLRWMPGSGSKAMRSAAALALRQHADPTVLAERLTAMAAGTETQVREAAAEIIGWQTPEFMAEVLSRLADDRARPVEAAALRALDRHRRQTAARALLDAIPDAGSTRRWSLLTALIEVADPRLLTRNGDPLCLWSALRSLPPEYRLWAEERLGERRRKVEDDERRRA